MTAVTRRACLVGMASACATSLAEAPRIARAAPEPRSPLALEKIHPAFARLPRAGLWGAEPAVHRAHELAKALGWESELAIVRDDAAGTVFGGGKARKLDLLLGEAIARGAKGVATTGGAGSNHARSTAMAARALGLRCTLALLPEPETTEVKRNLGEMRRQGATVTIGDRAAVERARVAAEARGDAWIPMGGTSPLGNVAFVDAGVSLAQRARAGELAVPDVAVTALGSTGSAVGLAIGLALAGLPTRVVAVRASSPATSSRAVVDAGIDATVTLLRTIEPSIPPSLANEARARLEVDGGELGGGYGVSTARGALAAATMWDREAIRLETTYGAKAVAALVRRAGAWKRSRVVLWMGCDARWLAGRAP